MPPRIVVTGTDTGIGKTVFAAGLVDRLGADYWKPVQAGLDGETDSEAVARLASVGSGRIHAEAFPLNLPASPHFAAASEGISIDLEALEPPATRRPLVIEGAGGVLVPLTSTASFADVFARWRFPVVVCALGDAEVETERIITVMGGVRRLGRLSWLQPFSADALRKAFFEAFRVEDFLAGP